MSLHKSKLPNAQLCPVRDVLDRVTDRWSILVIVELAEDALRFGSLAERIPDVSERMLSKTLRQLQEDGLVTRHSFNEMPPRVEYELTDLGRSLLAPISAMTDWAATHHDQVRDARGRFNSPNSK